MPGLGDEFRAAREARHLSLSDVSEHIHIRSVYLQGIEEEDWSAIGAPVYVRGFIRTYARFLAIDAERCVEYFNTVVGRAALPAPASRPVYSGGRSRPSPWLWLAATAALLLVAYVAYTAYEVRAGGASAPVAVASETPAASPSGSSSPSSPAPRPTVASKRLANLTKRTLQVELTQTSWVLVQIDGSSVLEGTFPAGTRKSFHGDRADVRVGNAGGVELTVNGKPLGSMGHAGDVVQRSIPLVAE